MTKSAWSSSTSNIFVRAKGLILCFLVLCTGLDGCRYSPSRAFIMWVCPDGEPRINLELTKATNQWVFNVHGFSYGNAVEHYLLLLPSIPAGRQSYPSSSVSLKPDIDQRADLPILILTQGEVVIDLGKKEAEISLETEEGSFHGNGRYPLSISPQDIPVSESPITLDDLRTRCRIVK